MGVQYDYITLIDPIITLFVNGRCEISHIVYKVVVCLMHCVICHRDRMTNDTTDPF